MLCKKKLTTWAVRKHCYLQNHTPPPLHPEESLVSLVRRRECFVGLSSYSLLVLPVEESSPAPDALLQAEQAQDCYKLHLRKKPGFQTFISPTKCGTRSLKKRKITSLTFFENCEKCSKRKNFATGYFTLQNKKTNYGVKHIKNL